MEQESKLRGHSSALLVFILTAGVLGIINTEMGVIGILLLIAETFHVTVPQAGWTVSVRAAEEEDNLVFHCGGGMRGVHYRSGYMLLGFRLTGISCCRNRVKMAIATQ